MNVLIAESGSTKTDWVYIQTHTLKKIQFKTQGINPYYQVPSVISDIVGKELLSNKVLSTVTVDKVYFYGAGCSSEKMQQLVAVILEEFFPKSVIEVKEDLLAAARSLCQDQDGIACILGTGSNSCYYSNHLIVSAKPNLGFWLGDEGSGGALGKSLIKDYLNQELPDDVHKLFEKKYSVRHLDILQKAYSEPMPNRYFATFAAFIKRNLANPYFQNLAESAFREFFEKTVYKYPNYQSVKIHFCGSIAYHFKEVLEKVGKEKGLNIGKIKASPLDGLVEYHIKFS